MAYRSKTKLIEISTGRMSYCHVDPASGKACQLHLHEVKTPVIPKLRDETPESGFSNFPETTVPYELQDVAQSFIDYAEEIMVDNHNDDGEPVLPLSEILADENLMVNNCGPVTWAVIEELERDSSEGFSYREHTLQYGKGVHVAVLAESDNGDEYVIDFTARQYDSGLPCPLVVKRYEWEKTIDYYVSTIHGDERVSD